MVIPEKKIALILPEGCGGEAVRAAMAEALGDAGGLRGAGWPLSRIAGAFDLAGWRVLALVRDPVSRAVACFESQRTEGLRTGVYEYATGDADTAISMGYPWRVSGRGLPSLTESLLDDGVEPELLRVEDGAAAVRERLGALLGRPVPLANDAWEQHPPRPDLSDGAVLTIGERWGADFDSFGYPQPPVLRRRIPRRIWMYWAQGWGAAPGFVRSCRASWERLNPGWEVCCLDDRSSEVRMASSLWRGKKMGIASRSDLLRQWLMLHQGGVWADATALCLRPLAGWIDAAVDPCSFFVFRDRPICTWFVAARPGAAGIREWLQRSRGYWGGRRKTREYFWMKRLFGEMLAEGRFPDLPWVSASASLRLGPHRFCDFERHRSSRPSPNTMAELVTDPPPFIKLSRHRPIRRGSSIAWLLEPYRGGGPPPQLQAKPSHGVRAGRKIYIDCGANTCEVLRRAIARYPGFEFHAFEPQPELARFGEEVQREHPGVAIGFRSEAVWIEDGKVDLFLATRWGGNYRGGSTIMRGHTRNRTSVDYEVPHSVAAIDFSRWLASTVAPEDLVIVKMDIEGAEFPVLEKLIEDGNHRLVDRLEVEFHDRLSEKPPLPRKRRILGELRDHMEVALHP